ncbi:MAG: PKD domain-containing protein [Bacteroidales bacterium]
MKAKKQNITIRELFRQKLENAEIIPEASVKKRLMRRVDQEEFLRFNPSRFNIYYLGGMLLAGITTALILFFGSGNQDHSKPISFSGNLSKIDSTRYLKVEVEQPFRKESNKSNISYNESLKTRVSSVPSDFSKIEEAKTAESQKNNGPIQTGISHSFSKNGLFSEASADKKKLQGGYKPDEVLIGASALEGCAPLKLRFLNKSISCDSCRWTFGDGGYSNEKDPYWIFDVDGEYKVVLQVFNYDGTQISSSVEVKVHPRPQAHFEITPEKAVLPKDEIRFLNYSNNAVNFKWDFGDGATSELFEPRHLYTKFSNYNVRLIVFSEWGCSDSLTVMNAFSGSEYFIDFPNAFIPNTQGPTGGYYSSKSDEAAQVFHPVHSGVSDFQLKIFSKLGILIFESSDINLGWDGYIKGQLSEPGVYIWKVRGKFRNGEPFIKMGDVTLLKN